MGKRTVWLLATFVVIVGLIAFGIYFFRTGGAGLYRTVIYYLIPNMPDKKYTWRDFLYKSDKGSVSGFYAGGDARSIKIWTLSGLKRFYHKEGLSIYSWRDTCAVWRFLKKNNQKSAANDEDVYFDISQWQALLKPEYYVTVWAGGTENSKVMIDKALARSGKYKVLGRVEEGVCE